MSDCNNIDKILKRSGTDHARRVSAALDPANLPLNDLTTEDWVLFAYNFAKHINYFDVKNDKLPKGDWQAFFNYVNLSDPDITFRTSDSFKEASQAISRFLIEHSSSASLPPHLTLFICFLQLLEHSKQRFNALSKKHLDFYYKEILQVDNLKARPDSVHLLFELAKKSIEQQIPSETQLNAGKDIEGKPLLYTTDEELIVNQASVVSLKSLYNDTVLQEIKASDEANTLDGFAEPLPKESPYWLPFGYTSDEKKFDELPAAKVGFAIASPILALQEGLRTVEITIDFSAPSESTGSINLMDFSPADFVLLENIEIYCSGAEEWIGPFRPILTNEDNALLSAISRHSLSFAFQLPKEIPALSSYSEAVLIEKFNTTFPLVKFAIDTSKTIGHRFYRALINRVVTTITINVDVKGAKMLNVKNDIGPMPVDKPFYPFTTRPMKDSNFYIDYPEALAKNWTNVNLDITWKDTPVSFVELYKTYLKEHQISIKRMAYIEAITDPISTGSTVDRTKIVDTDAHFKIDAELLSHGIMRTKDNVELFAISTPVISFDRSMNNDLSQSDPIKLSLKQSFLHELFPQIYALALTADPALNISIPSEPYTPLIEEISLNYTATESRVIVSQGLPLADTTLEAPNTANGYLNNRIQLFHQHPFGQLEEHNFLKITARENGVKDVLDTPVVNSYLVPKYCHGGILYIGLENAQVSQTVSLLVQVLEGSENPLAPSFVNDENIEWAILCDNQWKSLKEDILQNGIDNFLSSGIVKFNIPRQATTTNTLLPKNYTWIRARMQKDYDAVCKIAHIHAQAITATFKNEANELSHLQKGLPAETIAKLVTRIAQIKSVSQPYNSFNGLPEESDTNFYRRISERTRHKNRCLTIWDREHSVLQEFPGIYLVKCLNHTRENNFIAAGEVTIVVVPDMVNKNVFDIYQPRVSTATLNKIQDFVNERNSMHVNTQVINPNYEEVQITLEVKFYEGFDKSYYLKKTEEDITKFLSPWAFEETNSIAFGITLHRSVLISYLEKLSYVDYVQNVAMTKDGVLSNTQIEPTYPTSILVSAKTHNISPAIEICNDIPPTEPILCRS